MEIRFTPKTGVSLPTVTVDGKEATTTKNGKYYTIKLADIYASDLATRHTIVAGDCTVNISTMSYVYTFMSGDTTSDAMKDLLCAFYGFAQACR